MALVDFQLGAVTVDRKGTSINLVVVAVVAFVWTDFEYDFEIEVVENMPVVSKTLVDQICLVMH